MSFFWPFAAIGRRKRHACSLKPAFKGYGAAGGAETSRQTVGHRRKEKLHSCKKISKAKRRAEVGNPNGSKRMSLRSKSKAAICT